MLHSRFMYLIKNLIDFELRFESLLDQFILDYLLKPLKLEVLSTF